MLIRRGASRDAALERMVACGLDVVEFEPPRTVPIRRIVLPLVVFVVGTSAVWARASLRGRDPSVPMLIAVYVGALLAVVVAFVGGFVRLRRLRVRGLKFVAGGFTPDGLVGAVIEQIGGPRPSWTGVTGVFSSEDGASLRFGYRVVALASVDGLVARVGRSGRRLWLLVELPAGFFALRLRVFASSSQLRSTDQGDRRAFR